MRAPHAVDLARDEVERRCHDTGTNGSPRPGAASAAALAPALPHHSSATRQAVHAKRERLDEARGIGVVLEGLYADNAAAFDDC